MSKANQNIQSNCDEETYLDTHQTNIETSLFANFSSTATTCEKVAVVLQILSQTDEDKDFSKYPICPFESDQTPDISIGVYFLILCENLNVVDSHAILVLALINRLANVSNQNDGSQIKLTSKTIHR